MRRPIVASCRSAASAGGCSCPGRHCCACWRSSPSTTRQAWRPPRPASSPDLYAKAAPAACQRPGARHQRMEPPLMRDERSNPGRPTTGDRPTIRRRRRSEGRACRRDAQPALTTRDAAALRFVGEHYAVRTDVLAVVLGRLSPAMPQAPGMLGVRTLRQRLGRWQQAGWVERRRLLAHTWVLPTRTGLALAGLEFDRWEPAESRLAHH